MGYIIRVCLKLCCGWWRTWYSPFKRTQGRKEGTQAGLAKTPEWEWWMMWLVLDKNENVIESPWHGVPHLMCVLLIWFSLSEWSMKTLWPQKGSLEPWMPGSRIQERWVASYEGCALSTTCHKISAEGHWSLSRFKELGGINMQETQSTQEVWVNIASCLSLHSICSGALASLLSYPLHWAHLPMGEIWILTWLLVLCQRHRNFGSLLLPTFANNSLKLF